MNNKMINIEKEQELFKKICDVAVIVRNEQCSKRLAKLYSKQILINNIKIITADEIGECIYLSDSDDRPLKMIAEDKRVFAFYQTVLNDPNKQWMSDLHITGYFNAVHTAQQFYALFNELNENMTDWAAVETVISANQQQFATWKIFCEIYKSLRTFLSSHGLTDKLYVRTKTAVDANINNILTLTSSYKSIVFLDCWGETPLTGYMLKAAYNLLDHTNKPEYILTVPDILINQQTWTLKFNEVTLDLLVGDNKKKFSFVHAASPAEVYYKAVSLIAEQNDQNDNIQANNNKTTIIELDANQSAYSYMLSDKFDIIPQMPYFNSRLYVWLDCMYKLLDSITFNKSASVLLCDINTFRDVINTDKFIKLYFPDNKEDQQLLKEFRTFINGRIQNGYIYYDIDNSILNFESNYYDKETINKPDEAAKYSSIAKRMELLNAHISKILKLKSVSNLKEFFYNEIVGCRFFYDEHFKVFETFFTAIEDTASLERMGIVSHWDKLFPNRNGVMQVGINLLKILADYLKDQKIPLSDMTTESNTDLLWTSIDKYEWNSCGRLILLNMNEKVFPKVTFANSFFSEAQRISLGLPTSDDAVSVQRLMLTDLLRLHDDVTVISIENESKDLFGSGFIDEIKFYCTRNNIPFSNVDITFNDSYAALMQNILGQTTPLSMNENIDPLLFSFDMDKDLDNGVFMLSASRLKSLLAPKTINDTNQPRKTQNVLAKQIDKNQYTKYYFDSVINVKFFEQERIPQISSIMLGNIIHDLYRDTIDKIIHEINKDKYRLDDIHLSNDHIAEVSKQIINDIYRPKRNAYLYKVPDDWTKEYLADFIFPYAVKQLNRLLDKLRSDFGDQEVRLIPETEYESDPASNTKSKISSKDINERIREYNKDKDEPLVSAIPDDAAFILDARADFRAESDSQCEIIDYKTGSIDSNHKVQLLAYEKTYEDKGTISSFFFNVFETKESDIFQYIKQNEKFPIELYDHIYQAVNPIFQLQYFAPNKKYIEKII